MNQKKLIAIIAIVVISYFSFRIISTLASPQFNETFNAPDVNNAEDIELVMDEDYAPTQEELIKKYMVKSIRKQYEDSSWSVSYYDTTGLLVKEESFDGKKKNFYEYLYEFDKQGNKLKQTAVKNGNKGMEWQFQYDEKSRKISYSYNLSSGKIITTKYEYDEENNTETEFSDTDKTVHYFHANGLKEKAVTYDIKSNKSFSTTHYEYNSRGDCIRERSSGFISLSIEKSYNKRGQLTERSVPGHSTLYNTYDDKGLLIKDSKIGGTLNGDSKTYSYTFHD